MVICSITLKEGERMEYISAEEFLKQDIDIQIIFMEWWIPKTGDLFFTNEFGMECLLDKTESGVLGSKEFYTSEKVIPLLTEGQLRKFIEDNGYGVELRYYDDKSFSYSIYEFNEGYDVKYEDDETDLLQAYWKVALEIAKEKVKA